MNGKQTNCVGFYPLNDDLESTECDHEREDGWCAFFNQECDMKETVNE